MPTIPSASAYRGGDADLARSKATSLISPFAGWKLNFMTAVNFRRSSFRWGDACRLLAKDGSMVSFAWQLLAVRPAPGCFMQGWWSTVEISYHPRHASSGHSLIAMLGASKKPLNCITTCAGLHNLPKIRKAAAFECCRPVQRIVFNLFIKPGQYPHPCKSPHRIMAIFHGENTDLFCRPV